MDYVYICRDGDNEELRYSIRSIVKNLPDVNVILVGGKPKWYSGQYISVENEKNKFYSITKCWKYIKESNHISNNFILMNDDFYLLKKINEIPIMHGGPLKEKIDKYTSAHGHNRYSRILLDAYNKLKHIKISDPFDYDIHVPMPIEKDKITDQVLNSLAPRSMYGNVNNIGGTYIDDVKVYSYKNNINYSFDYLNNDSTFISSIEASFDTLFRDILKDKFTEKSIYE